MHGPVVAPHPRQDLAHVMLERSNHQIHADDIAAPWLASQFLEAPHEVDDRDRAAVVGGHNVWDVRVVLSVDIELAERCGDDRIHDDLLDNRSVYVELANVV